MAGFFLFCRLIQTKFDERLNSPIVTDLEKEKTGNLNSPIVTDLEKEKTGNLNKLLKLFFILLIISESFSSSVGKIVRFLHSNRLSLVVYSSKRFIRTT